MSDSEVWKDVVGFDGRYQVSNKGDIRSVARKDSIGRKIGGRTLKQRHHKNGYLIVTLCKNGTMETKSAHRIVAEAFIPNPNDFPEVNHIDEVKDNNILSNLEWCTRKYNANFGTAIERATQTQSKKIRAVNVETGEVITFNSTREARDKGYSSASQACRGVHKSSNGTLIGDGHLYKGHKWAYE